VDHLTGPPTPSAPCRRTSRSGWLDRSVECGRTASDAAALDGPRGPPRLVGVPSGEVLVQDGADGGRGLGGVLAVTGGPADQPVGYGALLLLRIAFTAAVVRRYHSTPPTYSASSSPMPSSPIFAASRHTAPDWPGTRRQPAQARRTGARAYLLTGLASSCRLASGHGCARIHACDLHVRRPHHRHARRPAHAARRQ
jgi:hypothetical protein